MRFTTLIVASTAAFLLAGATVAPAATNGFTGVGPAVAAPMALTVSAVQQAQPPAQVKVEISSSESKTVWYTQPIWLAVGGLAVLVIILLVVMAARGGRSNTTVVK